MPNYTGQLFIVAAPSGGGKTSLVQKLVTDLDNIEVSISHTTRERRSGETQGVHYFFVAESNFLSMVEAGEFIEHAKVYGNYYGTSVEQIESRLAKGIDVVLDIDWQGAEQLRHLYKQAVSVFVLPPSLDALRQRLTERGRENTQVIEERMLKAHEEMQHFIEFDYLIINDDFANAARELQAIVTASRVRTLIQAKRHEQLLSLLAVRP